MTTSYTQVLYEKPAPHVARIVMNRPEKRNAQGIAMTHELDSAFRQASHDEEIHVIILAASGDHFSSGHDLSATEPTMPTAEESIGFWGDYGGPGWEGFYSRERELYFDLTERWRNIPKPTLAEVQGVCIMGGNMLAWACDLIVCAEDAQFIDTSVDLAMPGLEWSGYVWELGARKAKEWLFLGGALTAREAEKRGMVNRVVPNAELRSHALDLASRIASKDRFALKLAKESVNGVHDAMGRRQAMSFAFAQHQIGHMQNMLRSGFPIDISRLPKGLQERIRSSGRGPTQGKE